MITRNFQCCNNFYSVNNFLRKKNFCCVFNGFLNKIYLVAYSCYTVISCDFRILFFFINFPIKSVIVVQQTSLVSLCWSSGFWKNFQNKQSYHRDSTCNNQCYVMLDRMLQCFCMQCFKRGVIFCFSTENYLILLRFIFKVSFCNVCAFHSVYHEFPWRIFFCTVASLVAYYIF